MTDKKFLEQLGAKIVALREAKSMTQIELARKLSGRFDTGNNQVRRIEKGLTSASIITLRKIAKELNISVSELVKEK